MHGNTAIKLSAWRIYPGIALMLLASVGLFAMLCGIMQLSVPPASTIPASAYIALVVSFFALGIAAALLGSVSVLWQMGLLAMGYAAIAAGCRLLISPLFNDPHVLLGWTGAAGVFLLVLAAVLGKLVGYLQRRFLKIGVHSHIKKQLQNR